MIWLGKQDNSNPKYLSVYLCLEQVQNTELRNKQILKSKGNFTLYWL